MFSIVVRPMGLGVLSWSVGRLLYHVYLTKRYPSPPEEDAASASAVWYRRAAILFYILGNFSTLLIEIVDHICHKRLYDIHLTEMREVASFYRTLRRKTHSPIDKAFKAAVRNISPTPGERFNAEYLAAGAFSEDGISPALDRDRVVQLATLYKAYNTITDGFDMEKYDREQQLLSEDEEDFLACHRIGRSDPISPLDIPDFWYSVTE